MPTSPANSKCRAATRFLRRFRFGYLSSICSCPPVAQDHGRVAQPFGFRPHRSGRVAFPHPAPRESDPRPYPGLHPSASDARWAGGSAPSGSRTRASPCADFPGCAVSDSATWSDALLGRTLSAGSCAVCRSSHGARAERRRTTRAAWSMARAGRARPPCLTLPAEGIRL
jgi:hypothetical protein